MFNQIRNAITLAVTLAVVPTTFAAGTDVSKLGTELNPLGGTMAGNADGSIPAWTGGLTEKVAGDYAGDIPLELFKDEKPLYRVDASNYQQYAEQLTDGTIELLKKYPETFYIDVYPTHRTAAAPEHVYDAVKANVKNCTLAEQGYSLEGCIGGIPFPMPENGNEVMWNFLLRVEAPSIEYTFKNIVGNADGSHTLATRNEISFQYPPYYEDAEADDWNGEYSMFRFNTMEPPFKAGESLVIRDSIDADSPRKAWQYLLGQRRVRRAPTVAYDTPDFVASGANYFDEVQGLLGHIDRYSWTLKGKKEMLVPYNNNGFIASDADEAIAEFHLNPEHVRWEKHRVWEVEAQIGEGKRHAVPTRTYYIDEDSWVILLMDGYDAEGNLWRTTQVTPFVLPSVPAVLVKTATVFNLQAKTMSVIQSLNGERFFVVDTKPETFFTGDAVAADAVR